MNLEIGFSFSHLSLLTHFISPMHPPLFSSTFSNFSSMMSTLPDAECWHPHINAKVNEETKGVKWFAQDCGFVGRLIMAVWLVAQQSDTPGLHKEETESSGNESRQCDAIYLSFIDFWLEVVYHSFLRAVSGWASVQHDNSLQEP